MVTARAYAGPERRAWRPSPRLVALTALAVALVAYATLCPIRLRPHLAAANVERYGAYAVLGVLVARVAGRRVLTAAAAVVFIALALEAAQRLVPGRHAMLPDALVKAQGGVTGVAILQAWYSIRRLAASPGRPVAGAVEG